MERNEAMTSLLKETLAFYHNSSKISPYQQIFIVLSTHQNIVKMRNTEQIMQENAFQRQFFQERQRTTCFSSHFLFFIRNSIFSRFYFILNRRNH